MATIRGKRLRARRSILAMEACEARVLMATAPPLGTAASFAILAGTTVTNTGTSNIVGNVGVAPGSSITGFPPGIVTSGSLHADDATAIQAQADLSTAYTALSAEPVDTNLPTPNLGGLTLTPGVYNLATTGQLTGTLTLDAQGDPNAVFVIETGTSLTTAANSSVVLINSAHARNIFWQVGSSATIGTDSTFQGNILAFTSITLDNGATIAPGRALAINGAVTLDTNTSSNVFTTPLTITADDQTKVYGAALPTLSASYTGFINGDTSASLTTAPTLTTSATTGSDVGSYAINASGAVDPDYTFTYVDGSLGVTTAPLTITAKDQTKVYGAALPTLTPIYTGFVNGDTSTNLTTPPTLTTSATAASGVGSYAINASGAVDPNYTISYVDGSLGVTTAPLTITADNLSKVYGAALPTLTATYTGFVNSDNSTSLTTLPSLATTATAASGVGSYAINASGAVDPNYTISYVAGSLGVTTAPLTITADNLSKVYGAALPTLTATYTGFVNSDNSTSLTTLPSLATTATAASGVGSYAITASGAVDPNYTISYVAGSLGVTAAPLTITADNLSKVYGAALPTLTATYTGFVNSDNSTSLTTLPSLATTATAASGVGSYAINASGAVDPNYTISYVDGSLGVTTAPLTITADNLSKVYGAALPTLTAIYTGFVNGDTSTNLTTLPTLATTATAGSGVGSYAINASGAVDPNYTISYVAGSLGVTSAPLTITADNQTKVYGAMLPTLTASYTGFVNGDTSASLTTLPGLATSASASSHVAGSPYSITASGAADPNYTISYVAGSLAVNPAPLTITADNQSKVYGAALPTLTATYTGFVNGDTSATLGVAPNSPPGLSTTATSTSTVAGSPYAISASGAVDPDYSISYVAGNLTVTPAPSSTVTGIVYLDLNANGSLDAGETGLAGRVVFLDLNHDGTLDAGDPTATTDANGNFTLSNTSTVTGPVVEATNQDSINRYVVAQTMTKADGTVTLGVVPFSPIAPVPVVPSPFSTSPNPDSNTAYVQSLYHAVLGRTGAASEVATWLASMNRGMTQQQVAANFVNSLEHRVDQVHAYYQEFLDRAPDATSVDWVTKLMSGVSEETVVQDFLNSPEYQASHQDSTLLIHDLYLDVLGRVGESTGVASWQAKLASGASRESIVAGFVKSTEANDQIVQSFYTSYLHRQRESGTTSNFWDKILEAPNGSATTVAAEILDSQEFVHDATTPQS